MSLNVLTQKSLSLFAAVGGWRTIAEAVTSRAVFLVAYLLTGQVLTSALIAVGAVFVFTVVRVCTGQKWWQATIGLGLVAVSAFLAGSSGQGADFYFPDVLRNAGGAAVFLVSMLVRWPVIGFVVGAASGERLGWRRDRPRQRLYQLCTAVFLAKFGIATAVLLPLYLAGQVAALGIATILLGAPSVGVCAYLCWRILRTARP